MCVCVQTRPHSSTETISCAHGTRTCLDPSGGEFGQVGKKKHWTSFLHNERLKRTPAGVNLLDLTKDTFVVFVDN